MISNNRLWGYPPDLPGLEEVAPDVLRRDHPHVVRYLRKVLPFNHCRTIDNFSAARLALPFHPEAWLWLFHQRAANLWSEHGVIWVGAKPTLMSFTASSFWRALNLDWSVMDRAMNEGPDAERNMQAFLALFFAFSEPAGKGMSIHVSINDILRPPQIPADVWQTAADQLNTLSGTVPRLIHYDRKYGRLTIASLPAIVGNWKSPLGEVLLQHDALAHAYYTATARREDLFLTTAERPELGMTMENREDEELSRFREAFKTHADWRIKGLDAYPIEVGRRASELFAKRRQHFASTRIFPSDNPVDQEEARRLFEILERRQPDFLVPPSCRTGVYQGGDDARCPIQVQTRTLPFYPGHRHHVIVDRRGGHQRECHLLAATGLEARPNGTDEIHALTGASKAFRKLNEVYKPRDLNDESALEYVSLFCDSLWAEHGLFHALEEQGLTWCDPHPEHRALVESAACPLRLWGREEDGTAVIEGMIVFGNSLSKVFFKLLPNCEVQMEQDRNITSRLAILPYNLRSRTHFLLREPQGEAID